MHIDAVVADANALLSAIVGKAALRVMTEFGVVVHVARFNVEEVAEYLPSMAAKYGLPLDLVELQWKLLPITIHSFDEYEDQFAGAGQDLAARDPEDAHALALARSLELPLWSNDRHLMNLGADVYSTARLLRVLELGDADRS
jgi:predicted nucleic acid-binding protein